VSIVARADGVHLGGDALPVADVAVWCKTNMPGRRGAPLCAPSDSGDASPQGGHAGPPLQETSFLIGASCHSPAEAQAAERNGAHYIFFGPVFSTPAKIHYGPPQGIARLEEVCRAVRIPVLAIGGITLENAPECFRAGAAGIAAIRLFQESADLHHVVTLLRHASHETNRPV
jgi:thiamine monophosphate synthase